MLTAGQLLAFGVAALILIAIPGPSVVFVIGRALAYGRSVALASVVGNTLGLLAIVLLVSFGLGAILERSESLFLAVKLAGAAYLVLLGVQAIRHRKNLRDVDVRRAGRMTPRRAVRQGFVVGISNPKAFVIIGAILPQFVEPDRGHVQLQLVLLGLVAVVIGLCSDSLWAVTAARLRDWFAASRRREEGVGLVGGLSMVGLGVTTALTD
ncbi:LysE family translocator [Nocardioides sp. SYSU D00038]|uniref:LysE family translocator n=1 Tax=Nocardioides sp. SYSU D00038 TaxID=2812554 RepID=UPI00196734F4|nr:LysE family translocator [Nocardioides sp. SYSU D00038]